MSSRSKPIVILMPALLLVVMVLTLFIWDERPEVVQEGIPTGTHSPKDVLLQTPSAPSQSAATPQSIVEVDPEFRYDYELRNLPARISIQRLGVNATVIPVGLDEKQGVAVPEDIDIVGWYQPGVSPHMSLGSAALVGHRDGAGGGEGVFLRIGELQTSDRITVVNRDGREIVYEVALVELIGIDRFPQEAPRLFAENGPRKLTLISCGGAYDRDKGGYQANIVVTAKPAA
jgi:sortase (surface protein transpeptidase)